jgi:hypothetical protein
MSAAARAGDKNKLASAIDKAFIGFENLTVAKGPALYIIKGLFYNLKTAKSYVEPY